MQFKVPQFIDVEDKLFGPFSFKQFAYMAGGAGLAFTLYKILPFWIAIFLILPVVILTVLLVFYRINNKPFAFYLQAAIYYFASSKLFIWKQRLVKPGDEKKDIEVPTVTSIIPMSTENQIKDISWNLDVKGENGGGR